MSTSRRVVRPEHYPRNPVSRPRLKLQTRQLRVIQRRRLRILHTGSRVYFARIPADRLNNRQSVRRTRVCSRLEAQQIALIRQKRLEPGSRQCHVLLVQLQVHSDVVLDVDRARAARSFHYQSAVLVAAAVIQRAAVAAPARRGGGIAGAVLRHQVEVIPRVPAHPSEVERVGTVARTQARICPRAARALLVPETHRRQRAVVRCAAVGHFDWTGGRERRR